MMGFDSKIFQVRGNRVAYYSPLSRSSTKPIKICVALMFWLLLSMSVEADTFAVTTQKISGAGSLRNAIQEANANPGHDIVEIPAKFNVNAPISTGSSPTSLGEILITDDITIRGLGNLEVVLDDHQKWISTAGLVNRGYPFSAGATVLKQAGLLFRVNRDNIAGRKINVLIENLQITHFARIINSDNADVVLNKLWLYRNKQQKQSDIQIVQGGGSLTISDSLVFENSVFDGQQIILANSDLTISGSAFQSNTVGVSGQSDSRLLKMGPTNLSQAIIKDSFFTDLSYSPFEFSNTNVEIANTIIDAKNSVPTRSIRVFNGDLTLTNSTLYYPPQTTNSFPALFQGTHIELLGSAQLIARNSLLLSVDAGTNTLPVVYPSNWNDTGVYARAVDSNNYISAVAGNDAALNLSPLNFSGADSYRGLRPNELSTPLVDMGDTSLAKYQDGAPIVNDYTREHRPQGGSIDIGALEKHETLFPHFDSYQTDEGVSLNVDASNGVLANDTTPGGLDVSLKTQALHGQVVLNADGSFDYTPDSGYYGHDEFVYELSGKQSVVSVEVRSSGWLSIPGNIQPIAVRDSYDLYTTDVLNIDAPGLLLNDRDEQNASEPYYQNLTTRLYQAPQHGTVIINNDGGFTYTPDEGYVGLDSFMYDAVDTGLMHSIPQTVSLYVKAGVSPGGKAKVATSIGSFSFFALFAVLILLVAKKTRINIKMKRIFISMFFCCILVGNVEVASAESIGWDEFFEDSKHDIRLIMGAGSSQLEPDLGDTAWRNTKTSHWSAKFGASYVFHPNWSVNGSVYVFDSVGLRSDSVLYPDLDVDYRLLNVSASYYVWKFSDNYFVPFVNAGVSYIDPVIIGDESLVDIENEFSPSFGLGVILSQTQDGGVDLSWKKMAGDINVLELTITLFLNE